MPNCIPGYFLSSKQNPCFMFTELFLLFHARSSACSVRTVKGSNCWIHWMLLSDLADTPNWESMWGVQAFFFFFPILTGKLESLGWLVCSVSRKQEQPLQMDCHGLIHPNICNSRIPLAGFPVLLHRLLLFYSWQTLSWHLSLSFTKFSDYLRITLGVKSFYYYLGGG